MSPLSPDEVAARDEVNRLAAELFRAAAPLWQPADGGPPGAYVLGAITRARQQAGLLLMREQRGPAPGRACFVCGGADAPVRLRDTTTTYVLLRDRWVKIGRAQNVEQRIATLTKHPFSVVCPPTMPMHTTDVRLVATMPGDAEHELHWRFRDHYAVGEWFDAQPVLNALEASGAL